VSALDRHGVWVPPDRTVHIRQPKRRTYESGCRPYGLSEPISQSIDEVPIAFACAARCLDAECLIAVADSILNRGFLNEDELGALLSAAPIKVQRLMAKVDGLAQSGTESISRVRLRGMGIHVRLQHFIAGVGFVDLLIGESLIIECDSKQHHTSEEAYKKDRRRDRKSLRNGYLTLRVTFDDVLYGWDEVVDDILEIVRAGLHRCLLGRRVPSIREISGSP